MNWYTKSESCKICKAVCERANQLDLLPHSGIIKSSENKKQILEVLNEIADVTIVNLYYKPYAITDLEDCTDVSCIEE